MIGIKRIYDPASPDDGRRILVDRIWPRGKTKESAKIDLWLPELAPSGALRKWFAHDPARWPEFKKRYFVELAANAEHVENLRREAERNKVTLLYGARDQEHNNAVALREYIALLSTKI